VKQPISCVLLFVAASSGAGADPSPRERGNLAIAARAILKEYCAECHGQKPGLFDALNYSQLVEKTQPIPLVNKKEPTRSQIVEFVADGSMPPGNRRRPTSNELDTLKRWVAAQAPQYPKEFDDGYVLSAIHADWARQSPPGHFRYVSFAHLAGDITLARSIAVKQEQLLKALAGATTREPAATLQAVDEAATIFRIDIDKLGWLEKDLFHEIGLQGQDLGVHRLVPFDLLLLENPYLLPRDARFDGYLGSPMHVRPTPFLRGDWLADVLAPDSPLADDLKSLVELADAMKSDKVICGPKVRVFDERKTIPGAPSPPLTAWYSTERKNPFEMTFAWKDKASIPIRINENFRFDVTVPKDESFRLLNIVSNGELRVVPVSNTVLKKNEVNKIGPTKEGYFKIASIPDNSSAATEHWILLAGEDVPVPTIVRSEHSTLDCPKGRGPVFRFVFDKNVEKFDPEKAARKLVELKVMRQ